MLDYCLINLLYYNEIESYEILGDPRLQDITRTIIANNNLYTKSNPDLVVVYKQNKQILEHYLQNTLTHKTKWVFIVHEDLEEARILFQFIRSYGEAILIQYPTPIIVIKNLTENFRQNYRRDVLKPITLPNVREFLNIKESNVSVEDCVQINGDQERQLTQSLASRSLYVYFGEPITSTQLQNLKELTKFSAKIIHYINPCTNETHGFFVQNDYVQQCWLFYLTGCETLKDTLNIRKIFLQSPV